jgi:hypothetical protein
MLNSNHDIFSFKTSGTGFAEAPKSGRSRNWLKTKKPGFRQDVSLLALRMTLRRRIPPSDREIRSGGRALFLVATDGSAWSWWKYAF